MRAHSRRRLTPDELELVVLPLQRVTWRLEEARRRFERALVELRLTILEIAVLEDPEP